MHRNVTSGFAHEDFEKPKHLPSASALVTANNGNINNVTTTYDNIQQQESIMMAISQEV